MSGFSPIRNKLTAKDHYRSTTIIFSWTVVQLNICHCQINTVFNSIADPHLFASAQSAGRVIPTKKRSNRISWPAWLKTATLTVSTLPMDQRLGAPQDHIQNEQKRGFRDWMPSTDSLSHPSWHQGSHLGFHLAWRAPSRLSVLLVRSARSTLPDRITSNPISRPVSTAMGIRMA